MSPQPEPGLRLLRRADRREIRDPLRERMPDAVGAEPQVRARGSPDVGVGVVGHGSEFRDKSERVGGPEEAHVVDEVVQDPAGRRVRGKVPLYVRACIPPCAATATGQRGQLLGNSTLYQGIGVHLVLSVSVRYRK
jgi:hypothetical protein